jgi:tetratricopeptide (TPR) repeat protein
VYDTELVDAGGLLQTVDALLRTGDLAAAVEWFGERTRLSDDPEICLLYGRLSHFIFDFTTAREQLAAAFGAFTSAGSRRRAAVAAASLARVYLDGWGNRVVGSAWLRRASHLLEDEPPCLEQGVVAVALIGCGVADAGVLEANTRLALDMARRFGDPHLEAKALAESGLALISSGRTDEGMARLDEAMTLALGPTLGDPVAICEVGCNMLTACARVGDLARAESWFTFAEELDLYHYHPGNALVVTGCGAACGALLRDTGRWKEAEPMLTAAVEASDRTGLFLFRLDAYAALADLRIQQGRLEEAERLLLGFDDRVEALAPLARLHVARGEHDLAAAVARRGLRMLGPDQVRAVPLLLCVVDAQLGRGDVAAAAAAATELSDAAARTGHAAAVARAALASAKVAAALDQPADAVDALEEALKLLNDSPLPLLRAAVHLALARLMAHEDPARSTADARAALALHHRVGAPIDAESARLVRSLGLPAVGTEIRAGLSRDGKFWTVRYSDASARIRDSKGMAYLAGLITHPGDERHVFDLVDAVEGVSCDPGTDRRRLGDAGTHLDAQAKSAYRRRVQELREAMDEADAYGDQEHAERIQTEMDAILAELARAIGLGGRDRRAASAAEKARLNVTRAVRAAIARIGDALPDLGEHLDGHVKTGMYCCYMPGPSDSVRWTVGSV